MNHLAHLALAAHNDELMVGGFLGDFVKGPMRGERPALIELGIRLHRAIDAETARDTDIRRSAERFGPALRRLAPIFVDILGDHLLATSFQQFHTEPLVQFSRRAYSLLHDHHSSLTAEARLLRDRLEQFDGLSAYAELDIVERGFARVAQRLQRSACTQDAIATLHQALPQLREDFVCYYPRLQQFVGVWLARQEVGARS